MKMKGKIDEILKQKYDEVEIPKDIFNFDEILKDAKPLKRKNKKLRIVASLVVVLFVAFGVFLIVNNYKQNTISDTLIQADNNEENNQENKNEKLPTYTKEITVNNYAYGMGNRDKSYNIYSIKVENIEQYSTKYDEEGNYSYPITKVKANVINCYKGENAKEVEFWIPGGVWNLTQLRESNLEYNEEEIKIDDSENIKINYYEFFRIANLEVGGDYITCLYEQDGELYVTKNIDYGFKELDIENNMVMNNNKEWTPLDLSIYFN